jgi:hyperosmotically inducible periplasmic protein
MGVKARTVRCLQFAPPLRKAQMNYAILLLVGVVATACDQRGRDEKTTGADGTRTATNAAADNTDKNERDRSGGALTPGDQGESEADRTVTQQVRQGVMAEDALSITGKNVKVITVDGVVTLRGPVKSAEEKATIASIAQRVSGVKRVDNQLETVTN